MAENNTYTQIHIQLIFAVKFRQALIQKEWKDDLYKYITGIIQNRKHKLLCINGMPDHVHILIGLRPFQSVSDLVQEVKSISSKWINENQFVPFRFEWQDSFGAFSYSKSQINAVIRYIDNQEKHHEKKSFCEECVEFLEKFEILYDEKYVFKDLI
ncbi:IS200/IS605 family transposase [Kaistella sp.]|uniref:IS200/IS605 family transposase n=1 Tax=Kaistella sp. TaxID=2782235 RepID=UPI003C4679C9